MNSHHLRNKVGRIFLGLAFVFGISLVSSTAVQAQNRDRDRDYRQDRDRDYRRDDRYGRNGGYGNNGGYGGYGNIYQVAMNQGYQDGLYTGSNDAQRGQNYNPQRSHFYRNGHGDNGNYGNYGRYGNTYQFQQAYRNGFMQGYQQGYQRYGGYNRRNNGRYGRWPF